jgi:hypothetical protein
MHGNHFAQRALAGTLVQPQSASSSTCEKADPTGEKALTGSPTESARLIQSHAAISSNTPSPGPDVHDLIPPGSGEAMLLYLNEDIALGLDDGALLAGLDAIPTSTGILVFAGTGASRWF